MEQTEIERREQIAAYVRFVRSEARAIAARFHAELAAFEAKYGCGVNVELLTPKKSKRIGKLIIVHPLIGFEIAVKNGQELVKQEVICKIRSRRSIDSGFAVPMISDPN